MVSFEQVLEQTIGVKGEQILNTFNITALELFDVQNHKNTLWQDSAKARTVPKTRIPSPDNYNTCIC